MRPFVISAIAALVTMSSAHAEPPRPVVVELFTSQGCSSCPPADAVLRELSDQRADVLPLAFHVTYWNNLGWRDPFSFDEATQRQRRYASEKGLGSVYTPQMVVDGGAEFVGSDRETALAAIHAAQAQALRSVPVRAERDLDQVKVQIGAGAGSATVLLIGYDPRHQTPVGRGENSGRTLTEANIVRAMVPAGEWRGQALTLHQTAPAGERLAVLLQSADGRILGAARATE